MRLLLADDEEVLCEQIRRVLTLEGHVVDVAHDGEQTAFLGATEPYDLVILDLGLPVQDGIFVLKEWRAKGIDMPVLILTARDGWSQRVDGLDAGADDYMTKPFHMSELSARVRALLRRRSSQPQNLFERQEMCFDIPRGRVTLQGVPVALTQLELAVLSYLVHNAGRYVSRTELSEHVYAYDGDRDSNTIAVFVARLRKKLGEDLIRSTRGRGYMVDTA